MNSNTIVLAILAAIIFSVINCRGQEVMPKATIIVAKKHPHNDWQEMYLKGKVKSVLSADVGKESSKLDTSKIANYEYSAFDTAGFIIEKKKSSVCDPCPNYRYFVESIFKYGANGFKTKQINYSQSNKVLDTITFFWSENSMEEYYNGASYAHYKSASYKYDNEGKIKEYVIYDATGKVIEKHLYKYADNQVTEQITAYKETTINKYDANGILMQAKSGVDVSSYDYKYDNYGNWVIQKEYYDRKLIGVTRREIKYF